jgi:Family of unknown function (DUF5681)
MNTKNLKPWKPGQSGNPGGKPVGSRNRLQGDFLRDLADDYATHGRSALVAMRENHPADYIRMIASLLPKQIEAKRVIDEVSDDDLLAILDAIGRDRPAGHECYKFYRGGNGSPPR